MAVKFTISQAPFVGVQHHMSVGKQQHLTALEVTLTSAHEKQGLEQPEHGFFQD
jgi:hypothetical protein